MSKIDTLCKTSMTAEKALFTEVKKLDASGGDCGCGRGESDAHSFVNTLGQDELNLFCLNCGGVCDSDF